MIRPTKYLDLNTCVLRLAEVILSELREAQVVPLNELDMIVRTRVGDSARFNFLSTLNLLYLVGKIDYRDDSDEIVFVHQG